jgi:hypothetical protein
MSDAPATSLLGRLRATLRATPRVLLRQLAPAALLALGAAAVLVMPLAASAGAASLPEPLGRLQCRLTGSCRARAGASTRRRAGHAGLAIVDATAPEPLRCNGFVALCDRRVDQVVFAGTHNSMSSADAGFVWPNQDGGLARQLADGVHAFLIDTHDWETPSAYAAFTRSLAPADRAAIAGVAASPAPHPGAYLCHVVCTLGAIDLTDGLRTFAAFLATHPNEVLILDIEDYVSPEDTAAAFRDSGLIDDVYTHPEGTPWPTLRELITAHHRVIVGAEHAGTPSNWYQHFYGIAWDTPYQFIAATDFDCAVYRGSTANPLLLVNHWIANRAPSRADALQVNRLDVLLGRAEQCQIQHGKLPNIIAVNFYATGDLFQAVDTLNGMANEAAPPPPTPSS